MPSRSIRRALSRCQATAVGTLRLTFTDGGAADFAYTVDGSTQTKSLFVKGSARRERLSLTW
jgi:hypothetical protein